MLEERYGTYLRSQVDRDDPAGTGQHLADCEDALLIVSGHADANSNVVERPLQKGIRPALPPARYAAVLHCS